MEVVHKLVDAGSC